MNFNSSCTSNQFSTDICIVGGLGHVGLPLGLAFAETGARVTLFDTNTAALAQVRQGKMPFIEYGAEPILQSVLGRNLELTSDVGDVAKARHVIIAVGTPVDEYLNPKLKALLDLFAQLRPYLSPAQTLIIRSTVFPRTCRAVHDAFILSDGRCACRQYPQVAASFTPRARGGRVRARATQRRGASTAPGCDPRGR